MLTLIIIEGIVILLLALLVAGLLRSHAEILRKLDALGLGDEVPAGSSLVLGVTRRSAERVALESITGVSPTGDSTTVALVDSRGYTLLAFLSTGCSTCRPLWSDFDRGLDLPRSDIRPIIVTRGPDQESPGALAAMAPEQVTTIMSSEAWEAFRVPGTPYFQLVDTSSGMVVGEGSAHSWPRVSELVSRALADSGITGTGRVDRSTRERLQDSNEELAQAGIEPGDPSLYQNPVEPR